MKVYAGKVFTVSVYDGAGNKIGDTRVAFNTPPDLVLPTVPQEYQGHWIEPLSGNQLHIAPDGEIVFDYGGKKNSESFWHSHTSMGISNGFLIVSQIGSNTVWWWEENQYYCRKGIDELRLLKWLKQKGKTK